MTTMNISLPDSLREFVEAQVANHGYSTTSEYLRELIRDAQKKTSQEILEQQLLAGLASGTSSEMTAEEWQEIKQKLLAKYTPSHT